METLVLVLVVARFVVPMALMIWLADRIRAWDVRRSTP